MRGRGDVSGEIVNGLAGELEDSGEGRERSMGCRGTNELSDISFDSLCEWNRLSLRVKVGADEALNFSILSASGTGSIV